MKYFSGHCLAAMGFVMLTAQAIASERASSLSILRGVWRADFSHDGSRLIVQMRGGAVGLWDVVTGQPVPGALGDMSRSGSYTPEASGHMFVVSFKDSGSQVFDATTAVALSPELETKASTRFADRGCFSPDRKMIVMFGEDSGTQVFEVASGRRLAAIPHTGKPSENADSSMMAEFSADGSMCFIMDTLGVLTRYHTSDWTHAGKPMTHPNRDGYSFGFSISRDGKFATTSDRPGENGPKGHMQLWDAVPGRELGSRLTATNGLSGGFIAGSNRLLVTPARGVAAVYEVPSLKRVFDLPQHDDVEGPSVQITPNHLSLLSWGYDSTMRLSDIGDGSHEGNCSESARIHSVLISPDSKQCFVGYDNTAFLLQHHYDYYLIKRSLPDLKITASIRVLDYVSAIKLSPNGSHLMMLQGRTDKEMVRVFNAANLSEVIATKE